MLASITPLGERGRHSRWGVTMAWFVVGSVSGGAAIGGALAELGRLVLPKAGPVALGLLAVVVLVGAGFDLLPGRLPSVRRQVNEVWLTTYRGWVYGSGFGFQLGTGVSTIVVTSTIYSALAVAVLGGSLRVGILVGAAFGLFRSLPLLSRAGATTPVRVVGVERSLRRWEPRVSALTFSIQGLVVVVAVIAAIRS